MKNALRISFVLFLIWFSYTDVSFAQTPGMIIKPALAPGNSVLDPDGDGYVSQKTNGVQLGFTQPPNNDITQSEIPYMDMQKVDPVADLLRGPNGSFSEIIGVDAAGHDAILWYADANNLLYRFRIDNFAPNSKSYSILLDTDAKFGFTGPGSDPNAVTGNPGFEVEIVLETNFNVKVYNIDGTTSGVLVASYGYETNCQKSIAVTVTSGDADYFYDFYVPFPTSLFNANTPLRNVALTCMNPHPAMGNNAQSDIGGNGGSGSLDQTFINIISNATPTLPGAEVLDRSACPTISAVSTTSLAISGTTTEPAGTSINVKVYQSNGVTLVGSGTTTSSGSSWSIAVSALSPSVTLAIGQVVKATATAVGKGTSADNCSTQTVTGCAGTTGTNVTLNMISGGKGYTITNTFASGTVFTWYNADYSLAVYPVKTGSATDIPNPQTSTAASQTITFSTATGQTFPNSVFYFTFQEPGKCVSSFLIDCQYSSGSTVGIPVISTSSPITTSTTSVSGSCTSAVSTLISLYANGVFLNSTTVSNSTAWTISGLNLTNYSCQILTATAREVGKCPTDASAGVAVSRPGTKPTFNISGCLPSVPISIIGYSNDADGSTITLYKRTGSFPSYSYASVGSNATVTAGAWTVNTTGLLTSGDVLVAAVTAGACLSAGPYSDPITISTQTDLSAFTIGINPVTEGQSSVSGTISGGSYGTGVALNIYVDQTLVGSGVTVTGAGTWTVGSLLSTDLYIGATVNVALTAASSCESVLSSASAIVQCLQPNAPTYSGGSYHYCLGGAGQLTVTGTQSLVIYQLVDGSGTAKGPAMVGTGGTITLYTNVLNSNLGPVYVKAFKLANSTCFVTGSTAINFDTPDPTPTVTFSSTDVSVLRGTTTVNLPFSAKSGSPSADNYTISYSIAAKNQGFVNVTSTAIPAAPGNIALVVPSNPALGTYNGTLTVTSSVFCTRSYGFTVTVYDAGGPPVISVQPSNTTICSGSTTTLSVTAVNATGYQWQSSTTAYNGPFTNVSGGSGAYTASYTTPALTVKTWYRVIVTNGNAGINGSVTSDAASVFVTALPAASGSITGSATPCQGTSGGYSIAAVAGATSYTWGYSGTNVTGTSGTTSSVTLNFAAGATSGNLTVTGTNSCGSGSAATLAITIGATPAVSNKTITTCNGAAFTVSSTDLTGTVPSGTTFTWPAPVLSGGITGSAASVGTPTIISGTLTNTTGSTQTATYTVTPVYVSCTGSTFTVTISVNPTINLTATPVDAACYGASTGSITLAVTGGTPVYTYNWGSGVTTQNRSAIPAGSYSVTVTDSKTCTATASSITVGQPSDITITPTPTNVACNGAATGAISLAVGGGTGPYTYLWNDGSALQNRTGLVAGTYSVTVTDAHGCTKASGSISVTENSAISASAAVTTPILCNGGNATVTVTASGGNGTLTYSLNGAAYQEGNTYSVAASASPYIITVKDASNCTKNCSVTVSEPTALALSGTVTNASCNGGSTGSIEVTASGGTGPYTYKIGAGSYDTPNVFGSLAAGSYTITAKDANNCEKASDFTVTQPSAALSATPTATHVSCNGGSNGQISLAVSGGTAPYTYAWTGPSSYTATTQNITGLAAGVYNVTITDSKSCTFSLTGGTAVTLTQPVVLSLSRSVTDVGCNGGANGAIDLTVNDGTPGYTYSWSNGATTQDLSSLTIGTYSVTVTDSKGCTATTSGTVAQPSVLSGSTSVTPATCNGAGTGSVVDLTVSGGTAAFTYLWSNSAATQDLSNVVAGTYSVTITDSKGCTATASATVTQPATFSLSTTFIRPTCPPSTDGSIDLTVSGGTAGYTYSWVGSNGGVVPGGQAALSNPSGLNPGTYTVTVTDSHSCTTSTSVTLTYINPNPVVPGTITKN